jgi:hypothetical protein
VNVKDFPNSWPTLTSTSRRSIPGLITGKVPAGRESDAIVHEVDTFTRLALLAGAEVPADRPIDGFDQRDFLLGNTAASAREAVPIFFGHDLFAVKWRNFKVFFVWLIQWELIGSTDGFLESASSRLSGAGRLRGSDHRPQ